MFSLTITSSLGHSLHQVAIFINNYRKAISAIHSCIIELPIFRIENKNNFLALYPPSAISFFIQHER